MHHYGSRSPLPLSSGGRGVLPFDGPGWDVEPEITPLRNAINNLSRVTDPQVCTSQQKLATGAGMSSPLPERPNGVKFRRMRQDRTAHRVTRSARDVLAKITSAKFPSHLASFDQLPQIESISSSI